MVDIEGYQGLYSVTKDGKVWSHRRKLFLKHTHNRYGYPHVTLCSEDKVKRTRVIHRLIALAYIDNQDGKPMVNPINGIKDDNRVENLEWVTCSENHRHAFDTGLRFMASGEDNHMYGRLGEDHHGSKGGRIRMPEGDVLIFKSQKDLCREFNLTASAVCCVLSGKRPSHKGWTKCA